MASSAIFLTIIIPTIIASTSGFRIESPQATQQQTFSGVLGFPIRSPPPQPSVGPLPDYRNQPIAGYPKSPPPNAQESGGSEDDLLPPFEDSKSGYDEYRGQYFRRSIEDAKVDPKTGYPLVADQSWKYAGGNEESLALPLDDQGEVVDPKTGYPLLARPHWKDAGGDGDILTLPLADNEGNFGGKEEPVDPKTGYPLKAKPGWKDAGGDGEILEPPLEDLSKRSDEKAVDPKTGYPLVAEDGWKDAGGDGEILELPLEESAVDPKTGYPLIAQPDWKHAGGDEHILQLPEHTNEKRDDAPVDPKTGYPLKAEPGWKDAGGNGDILELPVEGSEVRETPVDPKTGYPLIAQPGWQDAGGNGDFLQPPPQQPDRTPSEDAVDPKTGYPLVAQPGWKDAGGNERVLELPLEETNKNSPSQAQSRSGVDEYLDEFEFHKLTELQPPPLENNLPAIFGNSFPSPSGPFPEKRDGLAAPNGQNQKRNPFPDRARFGFNNAYTYTGPESVVVTGTRFVTDKQAKPIFQTNAPDDFSPNGFVRNRHFRQNTFQTPFNFHTDNGVRPNFFQPVFFQPIH